MANRNFDAVRAALEPPPQLQKTVAANSPNKEVFLSLVNAIGKDDFTLLPNYVTEDAELRICGFPEFEGEWRGRADVTAAMTGNFNKISEQRTQIESLVEDGDSLVLRIEETGRMKATDKPYRVRAVIWCSFTDGKLSRIEEFTHQLA